MSWALGTWGDSFGLSLACLAWGSPSWWENGRKVDSQHLHIEGAQNTWYCPHPEPQTPTSILDSFQGVFIEEVAEWVGLELCQSGYGKREGRHLMAY